jgi:DNA-binding MarR family transcriptional regulator
MLDAKRQSELRAAIESFYFAYRAFTARADRILARRGLGRVHHRILYFVGRHPGISVNELLAILGVSKQALNAPLRQLLQGKLIRAETAARDRRVKQLALTESGRRLEARLSDTQMQQLERVFESPGADRVSWMAVMNALAAGDSCNAPSREITRRSR